jgi:hypothetical protein
VSTSECLHEISNNDVIAWLPNIKSSSARFCLPEDPVELPCRIALLLMSYTSITRKPKEKLEVLLLTFNDLDLFGAKVACKLTQNKH